MAFVRPHIDEFGKKMRVYLNDSREHDIDVLAKSPRSQLSQEEKKVLDRAAVSDALAAKADPDKLKSLTPKNG